METRLREFKKGRYEAYVTYDDCNAYDSPRDCALCTIYSNHHKYNPDNRNLDELMDQYDVETVGELLPKLQNDYYFKRIYAYIHSGITLNVSDANPFNDKFDSGLFGIIAISKQDIEQICKEFEIAPEGYEEYANVRLETEVEELDDYYQGNIYRYVILKDGEVVTSTGGYYKSCTINEEDGVLSDAIEELKEIMSDNEVADSDIHIEEYDITPDMIKSAEQCLIDNGIEKDEVSTVLQVLGYILLNTELYPKD